MSQTAAITIVTGSPYTISVSDDVILVDVLGPAIINLPEGAGGNNKRSYVVKDISGNASTNPITIIADGARLIDGVSFAMLNGGYSHIQVVSDGTKWFTI